MLYALQVNKNVYVKGKLGSEAAALMLAFKSWFQPSFAVAGSVEYNFTRQQPRYGLVFQVGWSCELKQPATCTVKAAHHPCLMDWP